MLNLKGIINKTLNEVRSQKLFYLFLLVVLVAGLFFRVYRQNDLLGFWFDQGRDLLAASKIIYEGEFTLIGPTTGFEGIFRGPFYYYYLLPGILMGGGDPVVVGIYLSILNSLGILALYILARIYWGRAVGLISATLYSFSYMLISFDRWLSHPPVLTLFSPLAFGFILASLKNDKRYLIIGLFLLGITLQLEEAGMLFVTFGVFVFLIFKAKYYGIKTLVLSAISFLSTFLPLMLFELRHSFLITNNILKIIKGSGDKPALLGGPDFSSILAAFWFYVSTIGGTIYYNINWGVGSVSIAGLIIFILLILVYLKRNIADYKSKLLLIWIFTPLPFYTLFKGDIYGYYLAGVFPQFAILIALLLSLLKPLKVVYKLALGVFMITFLLNNFPFINNLMYKDINAGNDVLIGNQLGVMDFIMDNSQKRAIFIESYVPPQIPYAYQYLTWWYSKNNKITLSKNELDTKELYAIIENDNIHKNLRTDFIDKLNRKSFKIKEATYGGITVQKREFNKVSP